MFMMNKRKGAVINSRFLFNMLKMFICGGVAFITAWAIYPLTDVLNGGMVMTLLRLCIAAIPAVIVYVGISYILKVDEVMTATKQLFGKQVDYE